MRPLHLVVTTVTALVIGAFGLSTWRDRTVTRQETENDLREVAHLMEEHTRAALIVTEVLMARVEDAMGKRAPGLIGDNPDVDWTARLNAELPFIDSIRVFDAQAKIRASSYTLPPGEFDVRDRAYYTALRDGAGTFISPLIWERASNQPFVAISRRMDGPGGRFAGGIEVSLTASYFIDFYRDLNPANDAVFTIYKDDGSLVMRSALPTNRENFPPPTPLLEAVAQTPTGVQTTVSMVDGIERLYAFRRMQDRPLIVSAGLPTRQVFAGWRERTQRNGLIALAGLMAFWAVAAKLAKTLRREASLRNRAETLLAEKEMLFQEIHHRVKNNLQIIASFLTMQAVHSRDPATADAFEEALSRLQSMGLVHQILYEQNEATEVSMDAYLRALGTTIGQTFGAEARGIRIEVTPSDARLAMDLAVPLALFANEALTNALKHAFPPGQGGSIRMELTRCERGLAFCLSDDGVGMAKDAKPGLGMTILSALARQLGGSLDWSTGPGTRLNVTVAA